MPENNSLPLASPGVSPEKIHIFVVCLALMAVFLLDLITPLGLAIGALYAPVVLYTILVRRPQFTLCVAVVAVVAIGIGFVASPPAPLTFPILHVWLNRIISVIAVGVTGWLVIYRVNAYAQLEAVNNRLRAVSRELTEQQQLLKAASAVGGLGGWAIDLISGRVTWSEDVARIHGAEPGYTPSSIDASFGFYVEEDRAYVQAVFHRARVDGKPVEIDAQINTLDGRRVWVRAVGKPIVDETGRVVRIEGAMQDVTARKLADQAVLVSLQRFQQLAESMPITVWTATVDGEIDYVTPLFFEYAGISGRTLNVEQWMNCIHSADKARVLEAWSYAVNTGEKYEIEMRLRRNDGVYRWHLVRALRVNESAESRSKWYGSITDVHDQKETLDQASQLAGRLTATLESITDAFFTLDAQWNFTYLNSQAERLLKRSREDLIGKCVWAEFPAAVGTTFEIEYRRAMVEQCPVVFEQFYAPLDLWFDVHAYPSPEGLAVYFQDLTERRAAQAQVRLLELAISRLNDVVIITEAEPIEAPGPRVVFVNDAFIRRTGYSREEIIGQSPRLLQGPGTSRAELDRIKKAIKQWQPVRAELLNYTKAGDEFWIEIDIVPLADDTGWYTHWVAVERDITSRKVLEDRLRHLQRMDAVGQLTGGVAHDFNNLLTVMLGNAELLSEQLEDQPDLLEPAKLIVQAGLQGAQLTQRLLAFARQQPLEPKSLDVNHIIGGLKPMLARTLGEHIDLEFVSGAGLWPALVDPSQLEDTLLNLALNARDAMPDGGRLTIETGNIWFSDEYVRNYADLKPGQYVMIAVSDTGVGIAEHHRDRIFEPFFTTKPKGKGTGLGLPMIYGFLKQSGGHISVYSEPGQGTTVKVYLPKAGAAVSENIPADDAVDVSGGNETILLVEDEPLVREYAGSQLAALGYKVLPAANGSEALRIIRSGQSIDLLFTDVVMPGGISGKQLADQVATVNPGIKVLFTSGYTENAILHHGRLDPGVVLLNKPYRRSQLAIKVRQALQQHSSEAHS
ncbi:hybrid sensor histidine kinase/response regulator [Pusillimonas sp. T2]|uniref:hybrid sensor histidine kinase/response regulator n=1 Tax=Pusillimonas sp. T2 TaxID=1548123 RepID=UPI000B94658D|nr:PAS domain-containing sensor histidine kinase [Pusillimonas sp. T2]OXR50332.1 hybrid sensor histidine kinase/response regulator [Pusillimonas sp. T2]